MADQEAPAYVRNDCKTTFEQNLTYAHIDDTEDDFNEITFETAFSDCKSYMHAVHGMLYSMGQRLLWGRYTQHGDILMQMRFDGMVGFPGGLMDRVYDEPPVDCLNRELQEEINLNLDKYKFEQSHYSMSHVCHRKKLVTHFYVRQVTAAQLKDIERSTLDADDWGSETFGTIRVPLFAMDDGYRGLPVFLDNVFAGNAREQLLNSIVKCHLLTQQQCDSHVDNYKKYSKLH